jgi:hypothetical protein
MSRPGCQTRDEMKTAPSALPAVGRAASFCLTNLGWRLEEVSPADDLHQWAVLRTTEVPDTRPFDYYVEF